MNEYELTYVVPKSGAGVVRERVTASSEQNARALVRAKYGEQDVKIYSGTMTQFGGGKDDQRNRGR